MCKKSGALFLLVYFLRIIENSFVYLVLQKPILTSSFNETNPSRYVRVKMVVRSLINSQISARISDSIRYRFVTCRYVTLSRDNNL